MSASRKLIAVTTSAGLLVLIGVGAAIGLRGSGPTEQSSPGDDSGASSVPSLTPSRTPSSGTSETPASPSQGGSGPEAPTATEPTAPVESPIAGQQVDVTMTYSGWDDASGTLGAAGIVGGVIEDGGTCVLRATSGSAQAEASSVAVADASSTSCGEIVIDGDALGSGQWSVVLEYSSARFWGISAAQSVQVP